MPDWPTIARWRRDRKDFAAMYQQACEIRTDYWADQIPAIADDRANDYVQTLKGGLTFNREHFERSRLRVQSRQWLVARLLRQTYGDRLGLTGADGEGPIGVKHETRNELIEAIINLVKPKTDGQEKPNKGRRE